MWDILLKDVKDGKLPTVYTISLLKKGAMAFEISSPAGNRSACQKVTPGEKFAYLLMTEMRWPSSKKKKNPNGTSSVN